MTQTLPDSKIWENRVSIRLGELQIARTHRYQVTATGLRHAMFLTRIHDRILRTGLAELSAHTPGALRQADRAYQAAIDDLTRRAGIPA